MKHTNKEIVTFIANAEKRIPMLNKNPFINSTILAKINTETGGLFEDEFNMLMIGSVPTQERTSEILEILNRFVNSDKYRVTHISMDYAAKLMGTYAELVASDAVTSLPKLTERELDWVEDNTFIVFPNEQGDVIDGLRYSLKYLLEKHPSSIGGFIRDDMLTEAVTKAVKEHGGALATPPLRVLIRHINIHNGIQKAFTKAVYEAKDKTDIVVANGLLENVLTSVNAATPVVLELVTEIRNKIKELSGRE